MGIPGSNSEDAAMRFVRSMNIQEAELVPLVDSGHVVDALADWSCRYGVMAISNIHAGEVGETAVSLSRVDGIVKLSELWLPIHHCVFVNDDKPVVRLSSHIQALLQCRDSLKRLYPDAELCESEDTALSAQMLSEGRLGPGTAVVCRRNAGEMFGLRLVHENIEDQKDNMTLFGLFERRKE